MAPQRDWLDYVDVFGGLIMTILTFMLGFILARYLEKKKTRKEQRELRDYFQEYWKEQRKGAKGMMECITSFCTRLEENSEFDSIEFSNHIQPFFMYDTMDKQKLFDSFRAVGKEKFLISAMKFIELIRATEGLCLRQYEAFTKINDDNRNRWNAATDEYQAVQLLVGSEVVRHIAGDNGVPQEVFEVNRYYGIGFSGSHKWVSDVVYPLEHYLIDVYHANPDSIIACRLLPALGEYKRAMEDNLVNSAMTAESIRKQILPMTMMLEMLD